MKSLDITKEVLEKKYWGENLTQKEIADSLNVNLKTIYNYLVKYGIKRGRTGEKHCGDRHWNWKGGYVDSRGYKIVHRENHPNADKKGRIFEHRLVMSENLGRPLKNYEQVHHINGIRTDNRVENLELTTIKTHIPGHKLICPCCKKDIKQILRKLDLDYSRICICF